MAAPAATLPHVRDEDAPEGLWPAAPLLLRQVQAARLPRPKGHLMLAHAALLMMVAEDLRRTDPGTYAALDEATRHGCRTLLQIELGPDSQLSLGYRDDYGTTRWVHAITLPRQQ